MAAWRWVTVLALKVIRNLQAVIISILPLVWALAMFLDYSDAEAIERGGKAVYYTAFYMALGAAISLAVVGFIFIYDLTRSLEPILNKEKLLRLAPKMVILSPITVLAIYSMAKLYESISYARLEDYMTATHNAFMSIVGVAFISLLLDLIGGYIER